MFKLGRFGGFWPKSEVWRIAVSRFLRTFAPRIGSLCPFSLCLFLNEIE